MMDVTKKLTSLQEISKAQFSKILSVNPNTKHLVLEPALIKPLERVCGVKWLKGNGVDKIFKLEGVTPTFDTNAVFYMISSNTLTFKQVVNQIRSQVDIENPEKNKFHIIVVPRSLHHFEEELEEFGLLYSVVKLHSFHWMPIHIDTGVLSLEIPMFTELYVYQDTSVLLTLSKVVWQLCFVIGKPKFVIALGKYSNALLNQYDTLCEDRGDTDKLDSDFGGLIIIDRNVDYTSCLLTPGIYSGLLNEVYGVHVGVCESKQENLEKVDSKCNPIVNKQPVSFSLDSRQDDIYADIKNRYFTEVTAVLSNLTKQLKSEKVNSKGMALDEIKRYVQTQLQATKTKKKFITNHLLAAESIINILGHRYENQKDIELNIMKNSNKSLCLTYLDELLATENDKHVTLRMFCLLCITQGLSESEIRTFWRKYLHQFGFKHGNAFHNLINTGFIPDTLHMAPSNLPNKIIKLPKFNSTNFYVNAKSMKQIPVDPDKINLKFPTCASYVFGGAYIPLITQICNLILNSTPIEEVKSKLEVFGNLTLKNERGYPLQSRSILVYIIGGVSYAEIAACNQLETMTGSKIHFLTDKIITGNDLMKSMLEYPK